MAIRRTSIPAFLLGATLSILIAGCIEPLSPSSRAPREGGGTATGDLSAQTSETAPHGWSGFYPLVVGNRWHYASRFTMQFIPASGPPEPVFTLDTDLVREAVCAEDVTGRGYVSERVTWQDPVQSGEYWITSRQDRSGLYERDGVGRPSCAGPGTAVATRTAAAAAARARAWQVMSARLADGSTRAAWFAASQRVQARLAALDAALGRAPSARGGGPLEGELTRLSYPLHPGATWSIRSDAVFRATVESVDNLSLPAGTFKAYRIAIHADAFGPADHTVTWYGSSGYLALESYSETDAVDEEGHVVGLVKGWVSERLLDLSIGGATAAATSDPSDVRLGSHGRVTH